MIPGRIQGDIPSPSLHIFGLDVGSKQSQMSAGTDEHAASQKQQRDHPTDINRNKALPSVPSHAPFGINQAAPAQAPTSQNHLVQPSSYRRNGHQQPGYNVMGVFGPGYTAPKFLEAPPPSKIKYPINPTSLMLLNAPKSLAKIIQRPSSRNNDPPFRIFTIPKGSELSLPDLDTTEVINISPMGSNETLTLPERSTPLMTPTKRRAPPAPIRIPNGRLHAPAIVVERDPDLAELERHISTSMRAPRLPRKSVKRPKPREQPRSEATNPPAIPSHPPIVPSRQSTTSSRTASMSTEGDGNATETSNDEFRFSLGFLLQPERGSVMTTRTGRADSATLPELSPFLPSDDYIPPVPTIPPSLRSSLSRKNEVTDGTPLANGSNKLLPLQNPLRRSASPNPGISPLASAYSQLTANSRPYATESSRVPHPSRISEVVTEFSPAFTAASPLDTPERRFSPVPIDSPGSFVAGTDSPIVEEQAKSSIADISSGTGDIPGSAGKTPDTSSSYSMTTPELSPPSKPKAGKTGRTSTTPESLSYSSNEASSGSFEMVKRPLVHRSAASIESSTHRDLPKSAVPMSAISSGASTASLDQYVEIISFGDNTGDKKTDPAVTDLTTLAKRNPGILRDPKPTESTFAPNHTVLSAPTSLVQPSEARKLRFPPQPLTVDILRPVPRERRNSFPSPSSGISPVTHERRPSAPSPLTNGPILFTPSSHQPLQAAMSNYSSSGFAASTFKNAGKRPQAVDDIVVRNSNLSIRTDHIRSAPRHGLVPYTPFSQGSDMFTPATALIGDRSAKLKPIPHSALSTSMSVKLATRARTRPPSGPRKPRNSNGSKSKDRIASVPEVDVNVVKSRSRAGTDGHLTPSPHTPSFETQLVRFRGLTLDVAKWTFTQDELQEVSKRAICQSADPLSIRLLPASILDNDIPAELEKLELKREELKANYKYQHKCRVTALNSLSALVESSGVLGLQGSTTSRLLEELKEIGTKSDQYAEELYRVCDQIAQLRALQDSHSASALAMALRKINSSFIKASAEILDMKKHLGVVNTEREEAWVMADSLERELNEVKHRLEQATAQRELMSPPARRKRRTPGTGIEAIVDTPQSSSRVLAARRRSKVSLRRRYSGMSPQPFSALFTNGSIQSSVHNSQGSANFIPPLPLFSSAKVSHVPNTAYSSANGFPPDSAQSNLRSLRSESFSGTPSSSSRALINAQNELLQVLGVPVQGMTEQGFRRTRSLSDAGARASMLPSSPPVGDSKQNNLSTFNHRESRITSFYGSYLSRHNTIAGSRALTKRQTRASQWDMEAIYDGILDDPDTLFKVIKPGL